MFKLSLYILGIIFISFGIFFTLIYLNLLSMGYSFFEFVQFISRKVEFYFIFIGIISVVLAFRKDDKE